MGFAVIFCSVRASGPLFVLKNLPIHVGLRTIAAASVACCRVSFLGCGANFYIYACG